MRYSTCFSGFGLALGGFGLVISQAWPKDLVLAWLALALAWGMALLTKLDLDEKHSSASVSANVRDDQETVRYSKHAADICDQRQIMRASRGDRRIPGDSKRVRDPKIPPSRMFKTSEAQILPILHEPARKSQSEAKKESVEHNHGPTQARRWLFELDERRTDRYV
ncbi:hypothetical protein DFH09DRAFT_1067550 [Mycena vulgaris]|nr:hypothetical protein DFH09DRAFT_1067550 [Mycena vulgaris]